MMNDPARRIKGSDGMILEDLFNQPFRSTGMVLWQVFDDFVKGVVGGRKEGEFPVLFVGRVEEVDEGRVVFDEVVEDFVVG
jgi:hypothetical protein